MNKCTTDYTEYNLRRFAEILSYGANRADAYGLATHLIRTYGSIDNVFAAPHCDLARLVGNNTANYLKVIAAVTSRRATDSFKFGVAHTRREVAEYFMALLLSESVETVWAMMMDDGGAVIECKQVSRGTVNMSDVIARNIIEAAISCGSGRVVLAHNHPQGIAKASKDDISMTVGLGDVLARAGIKLEYHLVVAGCECDVVSALTQS